MSDDVMLGAEFPAANRAQWLKLVEGVLKGAPYDRLVARTYDGLAIEPLYPRAAGARPVAGRTPGAAWAVMQRVDHPDPAAANVQALQDLENGATGLTLVLAGSVSANGYGLAATRETLDRVLDGVVLEAGIAIDFNLSPPPRGGEAFRARGAAAGVGPGLGRLPRCPQPDRRLCGARRKPAPVGRARAR